MKIPKFLDDLSVISKLGDNPGADNGLTAEGLKAKFDEAGLRLQTFLNETLIEKINSLFSLDAPPHEGMNMTGPINMNKNKLGGLADPAEDGDAVNLKFANENYRAADWMPTAEQVGARSNTWLPTIDEIDAAPGGFGLGASLFSRVSAITMAQLNALYGTGWFCYNGEAPYGFSSTFAVYQEQTSDLYKRQVITDLNGYTVERKMLNGEWQPFEWESPPMNIGVEYRTTERWGGAPVYTQLLDLGTITSSFYATVSIPGISGLIRATPNVGGTICGEVDASAGGDASKFYFIAKKGTDLVQFYAPQAGSTIVGANLKAQIWYTKN